MLRIGLILLPMLLVGCSSSANDGRAMNKTSERPLGTSDQVPGQPDLTPKDYERIPPVPPAGLLVTKEGNKAIVSWKPSKIASVTAYRVYKKTKSGKYIRLAQVAEPRFVDKEMSKETVSYSVAAVTAAGTEGQKSEVPLTAAAKAPAKK